MVQRSFKRSPCKKNGMCLSGEGDAIIDCREAPLYNDYAMPLSEYMCQTSVSDHEPHMNDPYKETYARVCHQLDETLADPYLHTSVNLDLRFQSMAAQLESMIKDPEVSNGDNGRYLYHIDARVLEAYLGAFHYRALNGFNAPIPRDLIEATHQALASILGDFDGLYKDIAVQVALRRTEVEIPTLLLRTKRPDCFVYPTLFREDASLTRAYNHDGYSVVDSAKIPIQVKTSDYRPERRQYHPDTMMAIHQHVVNLDFRDGETHITAVAPREQREIDDEDEPYAEYDEPVRFVAWGAGDNLHNGEDYHGEYVQKIGGYRRDGLVDAIVREAEGDKLTIEELNLLNGASHYLVAALREKQL